MNQQNTENPSKRKPFQISGGGITGDLFRAIDWAQHPMGGFEEWPVALKTSLQILFHSQHPMFIWWGEHLYQFYNDAYLPSFGVGKHPLAMGQRGEECWPETWSIIKPQIDLVMTEGGSTWNENQLVPIFRNGKLDEVYWTYGYSPIYDEDGSIGGTLVVCTETTLQIRAQKALENERRAAEAARKDAEKARIEAENANRMKSAFLANMSHEIRTPLVAIKGFSELLLTQASSRQEVVKWLQTIAKNADQLQLLIDDVLDLAKVESGRLEMKLMRCSLQDIVDDVYSLVAAKAQEKGLIFKVAFEEDTPMMIDTDPGRLRQILLNVIGNAIKFTERGSVEVLIRHLPAEADRLHSSVECIVRDTGIGLTDDQKKRLFLPFVQADSSTTRRFGGTGLGLILSRNLVRALGGDLQLLNSRPGVGSTFLIRLESDNESDGVIESRSSASEAPKIAIEVRLDGVKVLLVDDMHDNRVIISRFLEHAGANVKTADNGSQGIDRALQGDFDLVLMDIQMPEMNGVEAMLSLRSQGFTKPIVALTAQASLDEREECLAQGFTDHISKPVNRRELIASITRHLQL